MSKRAVLAVVTFLSLSSVLWGQQIGTDAFSLDKFRRSGSAITPGFFALDNPVLFPVSPVSPLLNGSLLSFSTALDWMMPMDGLPPSNAAGRQNASAAPHPYRNLSDRLGDMLPNVDYATAEVGFIYGRSTGKFGGEFKQGYVIGEVGNDKFQISAGAAYEDSSWRVPRFGR